MPMELQSRPLDLDAVQAFVLVAELQSFTRAAESLQTTQSAISLKLKRLEQRLERRLLERNPRQVRLSVAGVEFLDAARALLQAHARALGKSVVQLERLAVGISDHVAGASFPAMLAQVNAFDPGVLLEVRIASSRDLLALFDRGELQAVIVRREGDRDDGELIQEEKMGWFAAPHWQPQAGRPLPLAMFSSVCAIRELAVRRLDDAAGIAWSEVFIGGSVNAVAAAISAGLAISALLYRVRPPGAIDIGKQMMLPSLPLAQIVLHSKVNAPRPSALLRMLVGALKNT